MYIVGLHDGHNASVALFKDSKLIFALQEERITREKNAAGFPKKSLDYMLEYHNLKIEDIEKFMIVSNHMIIDPNVTIREKTLNNFDNNVTFKRKLKDLVRNTFLYTIWQKRLKAKKTIQAEKAGIPPNKLEFVEHHTTHANTAFYCSHFKNSDRVLVVTMDGGGDKLSASISIAENGKLKRLHTISDSDSLGFVYCGVTWQMGMVPNEHEYKIMGLAPYAKRKEYEPILKDLRKILYFENEKSLVWKRGIKQSTFQVAIYLDKIFKRKRFDLIAGAVQEYTEEMILELVKRNLKHYKVDKLALSGGVFMNVKANQKVMELDEVSDLFVMPSCGDETNSMGAGIEYWANKKTKDEIPPLENNFCLGPNFSDEEIAKDLKEYESEFKIQYYENIEQKVAELLAKNEVVARVKGGMEFGARSLGHRSILSNPSSFENVKIINDMIKKRDFWMPFAGSYLAETADEYFKNPKSISAPYMILTFDSHENKQQFIEGAIHPFDKTTRPQVVYKQADEPYWNLINYFKELTGIGCVLNTSFNLHGLPVAFDVADSMHVMKNSGLKNLAIGNYLVQK